MTAKEESQQLSQKIASAHEEHKLFKKKLKDDVLSIKQSTSDLRRDSSDLMKSIKDKRHEMTQTLRAGLTQFKTEIETAYKDQRKEIKNAQKQRIEENNRRKVDIIQFKQDSQVFFKEIENTHQEMGNSLRSELEQFMSELSDYDESRIAQGKKNLSQRINEINKSRADVNKMRQDLQAFLKDFHKAQKAIGDDLRMYLGEFASGLGDFASDLKHSEKERKSNVNNSLTSLRTEHRDMALAWHADLEQLKIQVANTLKDYSDGLKMTQIAELLDIDQWRTLIPVMRELQQVGIVIKKGYLYCSA